MDCQEAGGQSASEMDVRLAEGGLRARKKANLPSKTMADFLALLVVGSACVWFSPKPQHPRKKCRGIFLPLPCWKSLAPPNFPNSNFPPMKGLGVQSKPKKEADYVYIVPIFLSNDPTAIIHKPMSSGHVRFYPVDFSWPHSFGNWL